MLNLRFHFLQTDYNLTRAFISSIVSVNQLVIKSSKDFSKVI